jgi:hypothetical protein
VVAIETLIGASGRFVKRLTRSVANSFLHWLMADLYWRVEKPSTRCAATFVGSHMYEIANRCPQALRASKLTGAMLTAS